MNEHGRTPTRIYWSAWKIYINTPEMAINLPVSIFPLFYSFVLIESSWAFRVWKRWKRATNHSRYYSRYIMPRRGKSTDLMKLKALVKNVRRIITFFVIATKRNSFVGWMRIIIRTQSDTTQLNALLVSACQNYTHS